MDAGTLIMTGIGAMMLLALVVIFFVVLYQRRVIKHQRELQHISEQREVELIQASIQGEEDERMRIAMELHDDVNATLASAGLFLYKEQGAVYDEQAIGRSKALLDETMARIRAISHRLQPAMLQQLGLEHALQNLIATIHASGAISVSYHAAHALPRVADKAALAIYRVSQEIIANILKHAGATTLALEAGADAYNITLLFTHDGTGLTQDAFEQMIYKKGAIGLKNIVNRLKAAGATIRYDKVSDNSYITWVMLPLEQQ